MRIHLVNYNKTKQVLMLTLKIKMHLPLKGSGICLNPSTKATHYKTTVMSPSVLIFPKDSSGQNM